MKKILGIGLITLSLTTLAISEGEIGAELDKYMSVKGAQATLPVSALKDGFDKDFVYESREYFNNMHFQMGGDHALYYNSHLTEFTNHAEAMPMEEFKPLKKNINEDIGKVKFRTNAREMTLDEYVVDPYHRLQGLLILHKGEIVYEAYPGINKMDRHIWMSATKSITGLITAQLEAEGKIDMNNYIVDYVPELKDTTWEGVKVIDVINHASALDIEEQFESILNPESPIVRFFSATFGTPNEDGVVDDWKEIIKNLDRIEGEKPGERTRYSSINSSVLMLMAENIENKTWTKIFEERVWGKLGARNSALVSLTPDGYAKSYAILSATLEDMARYALLYTPSWDKVANEQVVSDEVLRRIQEGGSREAFADSSTWHNTTGYFGEEPIYNSFHFDAVFEDGAMYKNGNLGQAIYIDPARDIVAVSFSTKLGEVKTPGFIRRAAKEIAGE